MVKSAARKSTGKAPPGCIMSKGKSVSKGAMTAKGQPAKGAKKPAKKFSMSASVPAAIVAAPWVAKHTCKCTLKYTDLHNLAIGELATRGGCPDAAYDAQGHYICSGCLKDWCFTGQSEPRRPLKFKGREEQNGWAFHCDHGVDVCMRCAKKNFGQKKYE